MPYTIHLIVFNLLLSAATIWLIHGAKVPGRARFKPLYVLALVITWAPFWYGLMEGNVGSSNFTMTFPLALLAILGVIAAGLVWISEASVVGSPQRARKTLFSILLLVFAITQTTLLYRFGLGIFGG
ncbi:hypothetical protein [Planctomicrobium piriforme]|uniref:Uncharacterized protein n=1 Tax=Planctomicrobium piriforme TaxID=1576369 RepID=A0A1I3D0C1_9PLAN|nr:hypothetical protein [Planctomicrobium piriforme]SFH80214.1 hypothetical protein SAMN05421753_10340 [Planctomicrobium piriforme]